MKTGITVTSSAATTEILQLHTIMVKKKGFPPGRNPRGKLA
ncbi:MAG: hypothetical protein ABIB71_09490 [Candidatus Woesearchaeota archaeon]